MRDWVASKYWSPALFEWWFRRFRAQLPRVRRALANVPTYMVPDDHDVSDDWYFSREWREQVFTRPLGVDIVRNGLMAYRADAGVGQRSAALVALVRSGSCSIASPDSRRRWPRPPGSLARFHARASTACTNCSDFPRASNTGVAPTFRPLVEFSFQVEGPASSRAGVDGRTKRRFPFRTSQAGGIDYEGATGLINDALPTGLPGEEATGLFGDSPMAAALPPRPAGDTKLTIVVTGVPLIGPEGMELALVPFQRFARLLGEVDAESWAYEPATFEAMLAALARYESVVLLSGDVHIGWSAELDYWSCA